jgi:hypothetical protein
MNKDSAKLGDRDGKKRNRIAKENKHEESERLPHSQNAPNLYPICTPSIAVLLHLFPMPQEALVRFIVPLE